MKLPDVPHNQPLLNYANRDLFMLVVPPASCASAQESPESMGDLTKAVIQRMQTAITTEDLEGWVWKASDLPEKCSSQEFHSGFAEIDEEVVDPDERDQLQSALLEALNRNSDPAFVSQIPNALVAARDRSLKPLYIDYLARYLRQLKDCNHVVHATLLALDEISESVYEQGPQSVFEMD